MRTVLSAYFCIALLVTCLQLTLEYREERDRLQAEMSQVAEAFSPVLAMALWNLDEVQLTETTNGIWVNSAIGRVTISNDLNMSLIQRERDQDLPLIGGWSPPWYEYDYDILHTETGSEPEFVGRLTLASNSIVVARRATSTFVYTLINAALKTFVLWLIFYYALVRNVTRPLFALTRATRRINPDNKLSPASQADDLSHYYTEDELGDLAQGFAELESALIQKNQAIEERQRHLEETVEELERVSNAKSVFLAHMSHELRTPMNGILGTVEILGDSDLNRDQQNHIATISSAGAHLLGVINNVLDFSKIESGKLELESIEFGLEELLGDCVRSFRPMADKKGVALKCEYLPDEPAWVRGDPVKITQILNNLIGNALKFTESGNVFVSVRCTSSAESMRTSFQVSDTGVGMTPAEQERIFDSFRQGDRSTTRRFGGTGLGLTICRQLVEAMNGTIELSSEPGVGTTVRVGMCLDRAPRRISPAPEPTPRTRANGNDFSDVHVLVAEDNRLNQKVIIGLLNKLGVDPDLTNDGREAVDRCRTSERPYDLVLMDIDMPVMDGWEATRELRASDLKNSAGRPISIVGLSAHALNVEENVISSRGMDGYVSKPISLARLSCILAEAQAPSS